MALAALPVAAAEKPLNLSLFTPISLAKATDSVSGFRFNLDLRREYVGERSWTLGLINHTTSGLSNGLQWGASTTPKGHSAASRSRPSTSTRARRRVSSGARSTTPSTAGGLQLAVVKLRRREIQGVQIGVLNIIKEGGMFPLMIIANWNRSRAGSASRGRQLSPGTVHCHMAPRAPSCASHWRNMPRGMFVAEEWPLSERVRRGLPTRIGLRARGHRRLPFFRWPGISAAGRSDA